MGSPWLVGLFLLLIIPAGRGLSPPTGQSGEQPRANAPTQRAAMHTDARRVVPPPPLDDPSSATSTSQRRKGGAGRAFNRKSSPPSGGHHRPLSQRQIWHEGPLRTASFSDQVKKSRTSWRNARFSDEAKSRRKWRNAPISDQAKNRNRPNKAISSLRKRHQERLQQLRLWRRGKVRPLPARPRPKPGTSMPFPSIRHNPTRSSHVDGTRAQRHDTFQSSTKQPKQSGQTETTRNRLALKSTQTSTVVSSTSQRQPPSPSPNPKLANLELGVFSSYVKDIGAEIKADKKTKHREASQSAAISGLLTAITRVQEVLASNPSGSPPPDTIQEEPNTNADSGAYGVLKQHFYSGSTSRVSTARTTTTPFIPATQALDYLSSFQPRSVSSTARVRRISKNTPQPAASETTFIPTTTAASASKTLPTTLTPRMTTIFDSIETLANKLSGKHPPVSLQSNAEWGTSKFSKFVIPIEAVQDSKPRLGSRQQFKEEGSGLDANSRQRFHRLRKLRRMRQQQIETLKGGHSTRKDNLSSAGKSSSASLGLNNEPASPLESIHRSIVSEHDFHENLSNIPNLTMSSSPTSDTGAKVTNGDKQTNTIHSKDDDKHVQLKSSGVYTTEVSMATERPATGIDRRGLTSQGGGGLSQSGTERDEGSGEGGGEEKVGICAGGRKSCRSDESGGLHGGDDKGTSVTDQVNKEHFADMRDEEPCDVSDSDCDDRSGHIDRHGRGRVNTRPSLVGLPRRQYHTPRKLRPQSSGVGSRRQNGGLGGSVTNPSAERQGLRETTTSHVLQGNTSDLGKVKNSLTTQNDIQTLGYGTSVRTSPTPKQYNFELASRSTNIVTSSDEDNFTSVPAQTDNKDIVDPSSASSSPTTMLSVVTNLTTVTSTSIIGNKDHSQADLLNNSFGMNATSTTQPSKNASDEERTLTGINHSQTTPFKNVAKVGVTPRLTQSQSKEPLRMASNETSSVATLSEVATAAMKTTSTIDVSATTPSRPTSRKTVKPTKRRRTRPKSSAARRWRRMRRRRRKQKRRKGKRKKSRRRGSMASALGSNKSSPGASSSPKTPNSSAQEGNKKKSPFVDHKTAYDFLSSQRGIIRPSNGERVRESRRFNRDMSEGMCEIFNKHFVPTRIGGKCV